MAQPSARRDFPWHQLLPAWVAVSSGPLAVLRCGDGTPVGERREAELRLGRRHASRVLEALGHAEVDVASASDRAPAWPTGVVGSISHAWFGADRSAPGYVVAAAARSDACRSLGIDLEPIGSLAPELWERVLTPDEYAQILLLPTSQRSAQVHACWCAKEATMKARREILDPLAVEILQRPGEPWFAARPTAPAAPSLGQAGWLVRGQTLSYRGLAAALAVLPC